MPTFTSAASTAWATPATWGEASAYPQAGDTVIINGHDVFLGAAAACANLTVASGSSLRPNTYTLTVTGTVVLNGVLYDNVGGGGVIDGSGTATLEINETTDPTTSFDLDLTNFASITVAGTKACHCKIDNSTVVAGAGAIFTNALTGVDLSGDPVLTTNTTPAPDTTFSADAASTIDLTLTAAGGIAAGTINCPVAIYIGATNLTVITGGTFDTAATITIKGTTGTATIDSSGAAVVLPDQIDAYTSLIITKDALNDLSASASDTTVYVRRSGDRVNVPATITANDIAIVAATPRYII